MNPEQIVLVKSSWQKIVPIAEQAAVLFYDRLFMLDPSLRSLFKSDLRQQGTKLMHTLTIAVKSLDNIESLLPVVQALGQRHAKYGVRAHDYDTVETALLWTLEQGLGSDFDAATRDAWRATYRTLSSTMQNATQTSVAA